eukprot:UN31209
MREILTFLFIALAFSSEILNHNHHDENNKILILGGGWAGVSAMISLIQHNITNIPLIEATDHLGGRVHPFTFGKLNNKSYILERGANWIQEIHGNPLWNMRKNMVWTVL